MKFLRNQGPALLWALIIFLSSSIQGSSPLLAPFTRHDRIIHGVVFFILALLIFRALRFQAKFPALSLHARLLSILLTLCYAAADEIHQLYVPRRSAEVRDFLFDALGAAVWILLFTLIATLQRKFGAKFPESARRFLGNV